MWTLILFGDYVAYYLAMGYGVDPSQTTMTLAEGEHYSLNNYE
jgi:hypothetical protein